jgi:cell division protein FtsI (penicillin-binding protein 3)
MNKTKVNSRKIILVRAYVVLSLLIVFVVAIFATAIKLQMGTDKVFAEQMSEKNTRVMEVEALRGNIYADDGSLLATSVPKYDVIFDLRADGLTTKIFLAKIDSFSQLCANMFPERNASAWKEYLIKHRERKTRYLKIAKDLGYEQIKAIKTWPIARDGKFKGGVWYEEKGKRMYFMGDLAKRTIGYIKDKTSVGLEGAFDTLLRGKNGRIMQQRMSGQIWRPIQIGNNQPPVNGKDIVTTLDVRIQDIAQYSLQKGLEAESADHGCVIVMETKTGAIKAMANLTRGEDNKYYETQNYAVSEFTEPGSTFKVVSAIALLEDGYVKPTDSIDNNWGKWTWYNTPWEDSKKPPKKFYTLGECLQYSSNIGTSKFVMQHYKKNPEKFTNHILDLGLHIKPKFDIPSGNNPIIPTPDDASWSGTSLPSLSIGYSSNLSPLQVLMLYNTIANKGKMMQPYMVKEIRLEGQSLSKIEPIVLKEKAFSAATAAAVTNMLVQVVDHGTAKEIKSENYKIAGKTGTSWLNKGIGGYNEENNKQFQASFAGFFPANNPEYTIVVVVNNPKSGKYSGAQIAAPIFKNISDRIYSIHIKVQPALHVASLPQVPGILKGDLQKTKLVLNELGISSKLIPSDSGVITKVGYIESTKEAHSLNLKPIMVTPGLMPDLKGMGLRDALKILSELGLKVNYVGYGRITEQSPAPNTKIGENTTPVSLTLKPIE